MLPPLALLLAATFIVSLGVGALGVPPSRVVGVLLSGVGLDAGIPFGESEAAVIWSIRLPRVILGVCVGAGLGAAGTAMQGVFRNPIVDPGLLGVSSGAAVGAISAIMLAAKIAAFAPVTITIYAVPLGAFAGALIASWLVRRLATTEGKAPVVMLLLAGIAVNALAMALVGLMTAAANDAQMRSITFWSLGSLGGATWESLRVAVPAVLVPTALLSLSARSLNALLLGESEAFHIGVNVERTKRVIGVLIAISVGAAVAMSGVIGFVGLLVPHLVRTFIGADHRVLLPASALLGGSLLLAADMIARTFAAPSELPVGAITAILGAPAFLWMLARERARFS